MLVGELAFGRGGGTVGELFACWMGCVALLAGRAREWGLRMGAPGNSESVGQEGVPVWVAKGKCLIGRGGCQLVSVQLRIGPGSRVAGESASMLARTRKSIRCHCFAVHYFYVR